MKDIKYILIGIALLFTTAGLKSYNGWRLSELERQVYELQGEISKRDAISRIEVQQAEIRCQDNAEREKVEAKINRLAPNLNQETSGRIAQAIVESSEEYSVDTDIILAIAHEESRFNPKAISPVGAIGVMQVMPLWSNKLDWVDRPQDLHNIETNIKAGVYIYDHYLDMFHGNKKLALLAYNRGPGAVMKDVRAGNDPDNGYPRMVLASYTRIRNYD